MHRIAHHGSLAAKTKSPKLASKTNQFSGEFKDLSAFLKQMVDDNDDEIPLACC